MSNNQDIMKKHIQNFKNVNQTIMMNYINELSGNMYNMDNQHLAEKLIKHNWKFEDMTIKPETQLQERADFVKNQNDMRLKMVNKLVNKPNFHYVTYQLDTQFSSKLKNWYQENGLNMQHCCNLVFDKNNNAYYMHPTFLESGNPFYDDMQNQPKAIMQELNYNLFGGNNYETVLINNFIKKHLND